ncbi:Crp/Fnr family transcriptional regulator, partial [Candidatus Bipolaricaulota bacterium]
KERETILSLCRERDCPAGEPILSEGNYGEELYVLAKGKVRIELTVTDAADFVTVEQITDGQLFGELALADRRNRSAIAQCETDCSLITIRCKDLLGLLETEHRIGFVVRRNLARILATRLRRTNAKLISSVIKG